MTSAATTFATTHWSVVLAAGQSTDAQGSKALEQLCRTYWYPLYAFVRRRGYTLEEAQDLTQEFFLRLLQKNRLSFADPCRGRFRSFLLSSVNHFLASEWDRTHAMKRGGRVTFLPFADDSVEDRSWERELSHASPAQVYEHCWALALLAKVLARLRAEAVAAGREKQFDELKVYLTGDQDSGYAKLAMKLETTEGALKMAVKRLRTRYGQVLREEIAHTVADPEEAKDELRHLCTVLSW
jgi:DNA-directed RNA polymerase specialized sigma24 family protein